MNHILPYLITGFLYLYPVIYLLDYFLFSMRYKHDVYSWSLIDVIGVIWLLLWAVLLLSLGGHIRLRI